MTEMGREPLVDQPEDLIAFIASSWNICSKFAEFISHQALGEFNFNTHLGLAILITTNLFGTILSNPPYNKSLRKAHYRQ